MAIQIQLRQGTTTEHNTFTGAVGEVTVDTTNKTLRVHDGSTVGGTRLAKVSEVPSLVPQATEAVVGQAKIATSAIAQAGVNDTDFITPLKLKNIAFGAAQSSKSKTLVSGTTYTNATNKPITLSVSMNGSSGVPASITVNNFLLFSTTSSNLFSCGFTVGVGESYKVTGNNITAIEFS